MERPGVAAIVIPAFNEQGSIAAVVHSVKKYGIPIVVNDASSDRTGEVARLAGADVVCRDTNGGYDKAISSGFERALALQCSYVVTVDADGQHDGSIVREFIGRLRTSADVVIGIRDRKQRFSEHIFAWVTNKVYRIQDPLCGLKGYRIEWYKRLGCFDDLGSIGTQLAIYAARHGAAIDQVPVRTRQRTGESRFGRVLIANYKILKALVLAILVRR